MNLTERDFALLEFLHAQGAATARQLTRRFFGSANRFRAKISDLTRCGLVQAVRVDQVQEVSKVAKTSMAEILGVCERDLWKYRIYVLNSRPERRKGSVGSLSDPKMWRHQIQLNEVRMNLEKRIEDSVILNDPDIRMEWSRFRAGEGDVPIPDLVIRKKGFNLAVELERTLKAEMSYYERFLEYRRSAYTHVLYFCESEKIFKKIADSAARFKKIAVSKLIAQSLVYQERTGFVSLESFLESQPGRDLAHG